jgi:hypothetical protein
MHRREVARTRLARALEAVGKGGRAVDVRGCGSARVAVDASGELVISARTSIPCAVVFECGHRLCPECAPRHARRHAARIAERLAYREPGCDDAPPSAESRPRFVTLTQPARPSETATEALERLEDALRRLVRSKDWKAHVDGGVIKLELEFSTWPDRRRSAERDMDRAARMRADLAEHKRRGRSRIAAKLGGQIAALEGSARQKLSGSRASWWHAHAHILAVGCYWRQAALLSTWRAALGRTGRYAADLERVRRGELRAFGGARIEAPRALDDRGLAKEVAKYVSKPLRRSVPHGRMVELLHALGGKDRGCRCKRTCDRTDRNAPPCPDLAFREWCAALESAQRKELRQSARKPSGGGGRRMLRPFGSFWGIKIQEEEAADTAEEGCDDNAPEAPIGVSSATGDPVMRAEVAWSGSWAALELRRALREAIHDAHEVASGRLVLDPPVPRGAGPPPRQSPQQGRWTWH